MLSLEVKFEESLGLKPAERGGLPFGEAHTCLAHQLKLSFSTNCP
jgi:hypothetical protein